VARRRSGNWGARLALSGAWWNDADLGPGRVSWTRLTVGVGLIHGWSGSRLFLDLREQLLAAALVAAGSGFDQGMTPVAFDPGAGLGLRAGTWLGQRLRLWADAGVAVWPLDQQLQVQGVAGTVGTARLEAALSVGGTIVSAR
jgi:hypothetical protein